MNLPHAPGYCWTRAQTLPCPLPSYTFIDGDGAIYTAVPVQQVVAAYIALALAGIALVDKWQARKPQTLDALLSGVGEVVLLPEPRQMELPLAG